MSVVVEASQVSPSGVEYPPKTQDQRTHQMEELFKRLAVLGLLDGRDTAPLEPALPGTNGGRFAPMPFSIPSSSNSLFFPWLPGCGMGVAERSGPDPTIWLVVIE